MATILASDVKSTWVRVNKQFASLMLGGSDKALAQSHVQGAKGNIMIKADKLLRLIEDSGYPFPGNIFFEYDAENPEVLTVENPLVLPGTGPNADGEFKSDVSLSNISQSTAYTCQSACIAMIDGMPGEMEVRKWLEARGNPGDPHNMGDLLHAHLGDRYLYNGTASVDEMEGYLQLGYYLIFHVFFTNAGHVIGLDGCDDSVPQLIQDWPNYPECHSGASAKDPWSKYSFKVLRYDNPGKDFYDGYYPWYGLWAAGVHAFSYSQFVGAWRGSVPANWRSQKKGYCHVIKTPDWRDREAAAAGKK